MSSVPVAVLICGQEVLYAFPMVPVAALVCGQEVLCVFSMVPVAVLVCGLMSSVCCVQCFLVAVFGLRVGCDLDCCPMLWPI